MSILKEFNHIDLRIDFLHSGSSVRAGVHRRRLTDELERWVMGEIIFIPPAPTAERATGLIQDERELVKFLRGLMPEVITQEEWEALVDRRELDA